MRNIDVLILHTIVVFYTRINMYQRIIFKEEGSINKTEKVILQCPECDALITTYEYISPHSFNARTPVCKHCATIFPNLEQISKEVSYRLRFHRG